MRNEDLYYGKFAHLGAGHSEELQINENTIPTVKQFEYLGLTIQENGSSELEIEIKGLVK
jgi:hypothetical protein